MYIYQITNLINNKIYIGKTIDVQKRLRKHFYLASTGVKRHFYNAIRKYGTENFIIEVLEECDKNLVNKQEKFWIKLKKSYNREIGYNKTFGGEGGNTWELNDHKEETINKLKLLNTGQKRNEEIKRKMSTAQKGKIITREQKIKISNTLKQKYRNGELIPSDNLKKYHCDRTGIKHSDNTKEKMSIAKKGKTYEEIYKDKNFVKQKKEFLHMNFLGEKNPLYKFCNMTCVIEQIKQGFKLKQIAKNLNITYQTLLHKIKQQYNILPRELIKKIVKGDLNK